jgi:hypothetical protein
VAAVVKHPIKSHHPLRSQFKKLKPKENDNRFERARRKAKYRMLEKFGSSQSLNV